MHSMYLLDSIFYSEWAQWLSKQRKVNTASLGNYHYCPRLFCLSNKTIPFLAPRIA